VLRAKVQDISGIWQVDVDMNNARSAAFDRMARRDLHTVIAMVVEGVALNETSIQVPDFGEQVEFSFLSRQSSQLSASPVSLIPQGRMMG